PLLRISRGSERDRGRSAGYSGRTVGTYPRPVSGANRSLDRWCPRGELTMRSMLFGLLVGLACVLPPARGQERPKGLPPLVMVTAVDEKGKPYIGREVHELIPVKRQFQEKEGEKGAARAQISYVPVIKYVRVDLDGANVEVYGI